MKNENEPSQAELWLIENDKEYNQNSFVDDVYNIIENSENVLQVGDLELFDNFDNLDFESFVDTFGYQPDF